MRICSSCLKELDLSRFYVRKSGEKIGQVYNHCISCLKLRGRRYYKENRTRQLGLANERRRKYVKIKKAIVYKLKDKPCADCGKTYPHYVMDFDHRDKSKKTDNIAHLISQNYFSEKKLLDEISTCDVVCANCHRIRTYSHLDKKVVLELISPEYEL